MARKQVEIFNKETFEAALPKLKGTELPAWKCVGLNAGEYTYLIGLGEKPAKILVRSSVDQTGWSRATGEDSIRVYVVDAQMRPLSGKVHRWTTRLPGWQERMNDIIRFLAEMAVKICPCPRCNEDLLRLNKVKKEGPNKGRWFLACRNNNCYFEWLSQRDNDDEETSPECPGCGKRTLFQNTVKKEGPNKGRPFMACGNKPECNYFQWMDEE